MAASVELQHRDGIALVVLNRPQVLNAVNAEMREALIATLRGLNHDPQARAVVITGAGDRAFCSGQDLDEISQYGVDDVDEWLTRQHAMYAAVRDLDLPCIAALNGTAAGAGFQIGLCADLRVGFPEMKLGQPEIRAGIASIVGSWLMTLHIGQSQNMALSITGELVSGQRGYELGLLNRLVGRAEVVDRSLALASELASLPQAAMRMTKKRFRAMTRAGFEAALEDAKIAQRQTFATGEPQAAMRKFLEARRPQKT